LTAGTIALVVANFYGLEKKNIKVTLGFLNKLKISSFNLII